MNIGPQSQVKKLKRKLKESREHLTLVLRFIEEKGLTEELVNSLKRIKEELYGIRTNEKED